MTWTWIRRAILGGLLCGWMGTTETDAQELSPDRIRERYEEMLSRRPRKGTALRNLYRMHVEALQVDSWLATLESRMESAPDDPSAAMMAGLAYQEHGNLEQAYACFARAAELAEEDWYPRYCLGETALIQTRYEAAIEHLSRAVELTGQREDRATLYMLLGKANLRARRIAEARDWFDRWVELAPNDPTVTEQVAELLYDEGETEAAAGYYRRLSESTELTPYQQVSAAARLAALEEDAGRAEEALSRYREILARLGPDSWLYEEVYARIEGLFMAEGDLDGLERLYREQAERNSADLDVRLRLAELLLRGDRADAGLAVLEEAVKAAPLRSEPRARLADAYLRAGRPADAIAEWERLAAASPEAVDYRVQLAEAWLRRTEDPDHRARAREWLEGIAEIDPSDGALALRAAEQMERLGLMEEATPMFARAAAQPGADAGVHEAHGRHVLATGDRDGALQAFRAVAAGDRRSAGNLVYLATVLADHGFEADALEAAREAVQLAPADPEAVLNAAREIRRAGQADEALAAVSALRDALEEGADRDRVTEQWILLLAQTDRLEDHYRALTERPRTDGPADGEDRVLAARMALALGWPAEAREWLDPWVNDGSAPVRVLELAESIYQALGDIEGTLGLLERIGQQDPRRRPEVLKRIVDTCRQAGDIEGAFRAAQELKALLPGSAQGYQLIARLHAALGDFEPAFVAMQEAIQVDPRNMGLRIELAGMYQNQLLIPEAIETYWQVLRLAEDEAGRLAVVSPLAELYAGQGRFEVLVERLRALERTARDPMIAKLALAAAHQAADDPASARRELTELAAEGVSNPEVLRRLVGMCRQEGDVDEAVRYQRRLIEVEPNPANYLTLGNLELERDRREEALAAWRQGQARRYDDRDEALKADLDWIRHLEWQGFPEEARQTMQELQRRRADDWRVMFEAGTMALEADDAARASELFRELVRIPDSAAAPWGGRNEAPPGIGAAGASPGSAPDTETGIRYPAAHTILQQVGAAKDEILAGYGTAGPGMAAGMNPDSLPRARAHAVVYLAFLEGADAGHDAWLRSLREGSRMDRRLLLQIAFALENTEFTRAVSRELVEAYPDDALGRLVMMTPSRAHVQFGMEDEFIDQVDEQLAWFRAHQPEYAWFHDLQELRILTMHAKRRERIRDAAERLVRRGEADPFVLAQAMPLLRTGELYDLYEQSAEGALAYYNGQGAQTLSDQLVNTLAQLSYQVLQRDPANPDAAWRIFNRYLDLSLPPDPSGRVTGQALAGGRTAQSLKDAATVPFPQPNQWWDAVRLNMLRRMHQGCLGLGLEENLTEWMRQRADAAVGHAHLSARLGASYVAWWNSDQDLAKQLLAPAWEDEQVDDEILLIGARLCEQSGDHEGAYDLVRRIRSNYGPMHREARLWLLRLAMAAGDRPAAIEAAEDLAAMRLNPEEILMVADYLVALGVPETAGRLELRAERLRQSAGAFAMGRAGGSLEARVQRVLDLDRAGDTERALLLARQWLRRPLGPGVADETRLRNQLLEYMQRRGEVSRRLREAEAELAAGSPGIGVREELFWYYWAERRYEEATETWNALMAGTRDEQASRLWLVRMLGDARAFEAALTPLEDVLRSDPGVLFERPGSAAVVLQAYHETRQQSRLETVFAEIEADSLMRGRRRFGSQRVQTIQALLQFAGDTLTRDGFPAGISLHAAELAGGLLTHKTLRRQFGPQAAERAGQALEALDRWDEAFRVYLSCVAGEGILRDLGFERTAYAEIRPMQGNASVNAGVNPLILRAVETASTVGRLEALADAAERAVETGEPQEAYLAWLCAIRLADRERAESWRERALAAALTSDASAGGDWERGMPVLTAAEAMKRIGWQDAAIPLLEQAFEDDAFDYTSGLDQIAVEYYADLCVAAGERGRARDTLLARLEADAAEPMTPSRTASSRAQWMVRIMDRLIALEYYADAAAVGHRIRALPGLPEMDPQRRRADQALEKLRREQPNIAGKEGTWADRVAEARQAMLNHPDDPVYWENLHGLLLIAGDAPAAKALRGDVRDLAGSRGEWRLRLGQAGMAAQDTTEAAEDFLFALRHGPVPIFQDRRLAREILGVVAETNRADEFIDAMETLNWDELLLGSEYGAGGPSQRINVLAQLAQDAMQRPIEDPSLAFRLARQVRRHLRHRPVYAPHGARLAGAMLRALPELNLPADETFGELLALMAPRSLVQSLAPRAAESQGSPHLPLGMAWEPEEVTGGLILLLDAAEQASRLTDLLETCRQAHAEGDPDQAYWACLAAARAKSLPAVESLLPDALDAAGLFRGDPDERAYLLCVLGRELSRANAILLAQSAYRNAVTMARQGNTDAASSSTAIYLASSLARSGDRDAARSVLMEPWSAQAATLPTIRQHSLQLQRAQALLHLKFYADAWLEAYSVMDSLSDQPQSRQRREAARFIEQFMDSHLDDARKAGDLLHLIAAIENQWGHLHAPPELWQYLQRLYQEVGDPEGVQRSIQRLEQSHSHPSPPLNSADART